jgi:hypothetical protein
MTKKTFKFHNFGFAILTFIWIVGFNFDNIVIKLLAEDVE